MSPASTPLWNPELDDTLVCCAVRRETHDVTTFVFEAREPRRFAYQPGQFMTFELSIGGQSMNRCYTLASAPTRPDRVSITVKRIEGGPVSNGLHETLTPGVSVRALGPMGDFTSSRHIASKYLFLSAGSGVTPLMSMTRHAYDLASGADIAFVHSARSPADLIFDRELTLMAANMATLRVTSLCEDEAPGQPWNGYRGRIDLARLELIAPDWRERETFVCGPSAYMAQVREMFEAAGFDMARYHSESFDFAELTQQDETPRVPDQTEQTFKVTFATTRRTIDCGAGTTVLDAAKAAGMRLPSSCTKGMCGTCKCKLVSGTVDMAHAGGIRQREIDQGLILICCAKPTSDLVVER